MNRLAGSLDLTQIAREVADDRAAFLTLAGVAAARALRDAAPLALGTRFGRYEIRERLGQGAMGVVYQAFDPELQRHVALKLPQFDLTLDATTLDRFLREARTAAAVNHSNICPNYESGRVGSTYFITMAFIDGDSLAARLLREPFASREAVELICKLYLARPSLPHLGDTNY